MAAVRPECDWTRLKATSVVALVTLSAKRSNGTSRTRTPRSRPAVARAQRRHPLAQARRAFGRSPAESLRDPTPPTSWRPAQPRLRPPSRFDPGPASRPAYPLRCAPGDNLAIHIAVDAVPPGHVLVVDASGYVAGYWGEVLTVAPFLVQFTKL